MAGHRAWADPDGHRLGAFTVFLLQDFLGKIGPSVVVSVLCRMQEPLACFIWIGFHLRTFGVDSVQSIFSIRLFLGS